jgi:hypothetical protein
MKNLLLKIFLLLWIFLSFTSNISLTNAGAIDLNFEGKSNIQAASIKESAWWGFETWLNSMWKNALRIFKVIIWWLLVVYIVYAAIMMILSLWDSEEKLSSSKKSIWYAIIWLLFLNIPWSLYSAFTWKETSDTVSWSVWNVKTIYNKNIFINSDVFGSVLWNILTFLQISVVALCLFVLVLQWIRIITATWREEVVKESRNKILYSLAWLVFIWIMAVWKNVVFMSDITGWRDLFSTMANLALFFAWPIAIFFLSMAGYYFITSGWQEDRIKKAKSIVINTAFATLILLWMYTFLLELKWFKMS